MSYNTIIYTRVSTDEQADNGFSLRHQQEMLERYCELKGLNIIKHYQDDYSAKNFNRPEWKKLETYVKANRKSIDQILILKWDRFSRNIEEALGKIRMFRDWGIEINSIEQPLDLSNPDNKIMLTLYLAMPEVENDKISQRTKDGILRARKEGAYTSRPPYGYTRCLIDGKTSMQPNEDARIVKELFEIVSKGVGAVEHIRKSYLKKGFNRCKQSFYYMLRNKLYIGKVQVPEYKKEDAYWHDGLHDAIVDEVTFNKVQDVLDGKKRKAKYPTKKNEILPLRSFLKCAVCNENLTGSISKGNGGKYGYYHCRKGCKNRIPSNTAHQLFHDDILSKIAVNTNVIELYKETITDVLKSKKGNQSQQIVNLKEQIEQTIKDIETLEDKLISGGISDDTFNSINKRYNEKLMSLKAELAETKNNKETSLKYVESAFKIICELPKLFNSSNYDDKITILGLLFPEKILMEKGECRTIEQNIVIELLTRVSKGLESFKNKKAIISDGLSNIAPLIDESCSFKMFKF
ncbi:recombinase family protein [Mesoflavibacter zeaxanthinifaciens]|uniref:recombinase family protein n=1 Tax=Mesoflavibacter zeaxanthinifaciens TaxID=393060 RepID=UPI0026EC1829|nr:recombinase family protein [Mesoflavibacter zeaxanthinifaciens]